MSLTLILFMLLGYSTYWAIKIAAAILGDAPVKTYKEFMKLYYREFIISLVSLMLIAEGGSDLPDTVGKVSTPLTAFAVGGSLPSIAMNVFGLVMPWLKK